MGIIGGVKGENGAILFPAPVRTAHTGPNAGGDETEKTLLPAGRGLQRQAPLDFFRRL